MHPSLSVIFFTTASGAGYGLLALTGLLAPFSLLPQDWRFGGSSLRRARLALRLTRDLEINAAGVALVLDLLDQIEDLKAQLKRGGGRH